MYTHREVTGPKLTLTLPGPSAGMSGSLDSYCSLKPLCSGMGEVVLARTLPTLLPPSPRTVLSLSCFMCRSASIAVSGTLRVKCTYSRSQMMQLPSMEEDTHSRSSLRTLMQVTDALCSCSLNSNFVTNTGWPLALDEMLTSQTRTSPFIPPVTMCLLSE